MTFKKPELCFPGSRPQIQVVRNKENPYSRVRSPLLPDAAKGRQVRERDVRA